MSEVSPVDRQAGEMLAVLPVTQQFNPDLAGKEWGWRRFGKKFGISVLVTRGGWLGVRPHLWRDRWTFTVSINLGLLNLWLRVPYR